MVDLNVDHIITTGQIQSANRGVAGSSPAESFTSLCSLHCEGLGFDHLRELFLSLIVV